jgi:3-methylfumaryl-CoA hydratase
MTDTSTSVALDDLLRGWAPPQVVTTRHVDLWSATAFAALLDLDPPVHGEGDPLPPMWHWFTLLDAPPQRGLGRDGHPSDGAFLPTDPGQTAHVRRRATAAVGPDCRGR